MKIDASFPPPPQHNQKPLPCSDITPARQRALDRLASIAAFAESLIGSIPAASAEAPPPPYPATTRGFALHCFKDATYVAEIAELLARSKVHIAENDHVDMPHVMLIDVRKYWGVLGPIRGDIVLFADGQAAVVTAALCRGCQHFEAVSLTLDAEPQIVKRTQWTSTVKWIIRLVDEDELPAQAAPEMASPDVHNAITSETAPPAEESAQAPEPAPSGTPKRSRKTGQP